MRSLDPENHNFKKCLHGHVPYSASFDECPSCKIERNRSSAEQCPHGKCQLRAEHFGPCNTMAQPSALSSNLRSLLKDARASVAKAADADCVCVDGPQRCKYCAPHRALIERIDAELASLSALKCPHCGEKIRGHCLQCGGEFQKPPLTPVETSSDACAEFVRMQHDICARLGVDQDTDPIHLHELALSAIDRLRGETTSPQSPIASVYVHSDDSVSCKLYAPGLPPGEHDLYCEPPTPGGQKVPFFETNEGQTGAMAELCALRAELELSVEHIEAANAACETASKTIDAYRALYGPLPAEKTDEELPESLRDPIKALERGRQVLDKLEAPYLHDRANGVKGVYCIARQRDGITECWTGKKWAAFCDDFIFDLRPPEKTSEACRIMEYDGAFKCYTHNKSWGAVPMPEAPCVGWQSPNGEAKP